MNFLFRIMESFVKLEGFFPQKRLFYDAHFSCSKIGYSDLNHQYANQIPKVVEKSFAE